MHEICSNCPSLAVLCLAVIASLVLWLVNRGLSKGAEYNRQWLVWQPQSRPLKASDFKLETSSLGSLAAESAECVGTSALILRKRANGKYRLRRCDQRGSDAGDWGRQSHRSNTAGLEVGDRVLGSLGWQMWPTSGARP